jgi:DNA-binding response OmpR family regulator
MVARILVVEDDRVIAEVLQSYLRGAGHDVEWCADGSTAASRWARHPPDLVVLDLMLPGLSGLELLRRHRRSGHPAPVLVLSARGDEEDRLVGFETGADDYVVKPFSPRELVLRVEALLRRSAHPALGPPADRPIEVGPLRLDVAAREVRRAGTPLALTMREFDLLLFLAQHPGQTFSKAELLQRVWGWDFGDTSTVTVHVRRVREKIETDPSAPVLLLTVGRAGYRMARSDELTTIPDA